ncbi:MAG: 5'-methylthioadenosine/S-adenosylhomocysteine nucleosidase [Clostridia bacterium]|nr:5'-methylthioadenosine/S-adenosylhomocysteine nucleosidase [Clostridia bacterium]
MIGIIVAMQCEADILLDKMEINMVKTFCDKPIYEGVLFEKEVVVILCGIGKVNAACGAQMAIDLYHVQSLINLGVAGGIGDSVEVAGVYQIDKAVQYDFDLAGLNGTKIGTLDEFKENYLSLATLRPVIVPIRALATGDRFNDDPNDHDLIENYMKADIRDMEGGAIAQVAVHAGVPLYSWKAISDKYGSGSSFEQFNANKTRALKNLQDKLEELFFLLPDEE